MEDDLFLDDEAEETKPKPKSKPRPKSGAKAKKASSGTKSTEAKTSAKGPAKEEKVPPAPRDESQSISLMAASIIVISAFIAGLAIGGLIFSSPQQQPSPVETQSQTIAPGQSMPGGSQQAPPLSQQQQGQGLPKGHPTVPGQSGTATQSPSK